MLSSLKIILPCIFWDGNPEEAKRIIDAVNIPKELGILERMVNAFLEYAETQTMRKIPLTMEDWKSRLDQFLKLFDQHAPKYAGDPVDAYKAQLYAESEFERYRIVQDRIFMSDYDRYLLELEEQIKNDETEKDKDSK